MIIIENLTIGYSSENIIEDLNISWELGQIHGLVGLNGSGKSTLLKGVYGLIKPRKGKILHNNTRLLKSDISLLETDIFFYSRITGREYLEIFKSVKKDFDMEQWNNVFELPLDTLIENYSTGMKKKLAFMGVVSLKKPILILDEPLNGIDLEATQKIKIIIKALKEKGFTIIITSHIIEALLSICDTISYLNNKRIAFTAQQSEFSSLEERIFGQFERENELFIKNLLNK